MKRTMPAVFLWLILLFSAAVAGAQEYPKPTGFVNDFAGELSSGQHQQLEGIARQIRDRATLELAFVTMDSIPEGQAIAMYATELAHAWGVGAKDDRGALLLYSTGRADGRRQVFLATGYGVEGAIPDARAGQILDEITIPRLKMGKTYEAFVASAVVITGLVAPDVELTGDVPRVRMQEPAEGPGLIGILIMIGFLILMSSSRFGRGMLFGMLLGNLLGGHRGHWGGGGGFGGGGFGGGFGGFGGGGFGGGGAGRGF